MKNNMDKLNCGECGYYNYGFCEFYRQSGYKKSRLACSDFTTKKLEDIIRTESLKYCGYCAYFDEGMCLPKNKEVEEKRKGCNYWSSYDGSKSMSFSEQILLGERMKREQRYKISQYYRNKSRG
ncbi:MAG: hypothetical protein JXR88_08825 [Clostridia bacterium]|nr:hypothetical protein [Clostridia bacterium]